MKKTVTEMRQTANELRLNALAMLKRAKEQEAKEKQKSFIQLGELVMQFVKGEIKSKEFSTEVKKITGREFIIEQINHKPFSESEVAEALK